MESKLRVIDLTSKNITCKEDVKVVFSDYKEKRLVMMPPHQMTIYNPGMMLIQEVVSLEARDPLEVGYTGFYNERVCIVCDLTDESLDKLIALENFIDRWYSWMFRIPENQEKPEISLVFTELPYAFNDDGIPTAKSAKIAAALKWQTIMMNYLNIKITAIGDYSAPIDTSKYGYNKKKVYVDTCLAGFYDCSLRSIVHVINPISDVLKFISTSKKFEKDTVVWISPSIFSLIPSYDLEDAFIGKYVVKNNKDVNFLMYHKIVDKVNVEFSTDGWRPDGTFDIEKGIKDAGYNTEEPKNIVCIATSIHDFMTFEQDIVMLGANTRSTSDPLNLGLFINYTPEKADDQKLYEMSNNFMNFIEDLAPIVSPTFYMNDIEAASLVDVDKSLLRYIPKNIEIYPTKLLDSICS